LTQSREGDESFHQLTIGKFTFAALGVSLISNTMSLLTVIELEK